MNSSLQQTDPILYTIEEGEKSRQRAGVELIASENYVSKNVLSAIGSVFTNRYSEGYPGKRYYGGQQFTDQMEQIAIDRAKKLFKGADHANVQPLSGALANHAVQFAWLEPGDTIMAMDLSHGGHLTHGHPTTITSKLFNFIRYKVKDIETGEIDFDELRAIAKKNKPKIILAGYSAYPKDLDYHKFAEIAEEVGAIAWADVCHIAGMIAAGLMNNPFDANFHIVSTTTHKTLRGPRGAIIMSRGTVTNPLKPVEKTVENLPTLIDRMVFPGLQGGPIMNINFAKAVAFGEDLQPEFKDYAKQVMENARRLANKLMENGFKLYTNGTENHLMVIDMQSSFGMDGKTTEMLLDKVGITTSKSTIPDDPNPPFKPSGLRLGTPAMTTRGMKETDMDMIAEWIHKAITHRTDEDYLEKLHKEVQTYCNAFPLPGLDD